MAKRANGEGTIQKLDNGKYMALLRFRSYVDGKIHSKKKINCKSEAEAKRVIKAWRKEIDAADHVDVRTDTVEKFMTTWLNTFKKPDLKPTSYDRLEMTLKLHIFPQLGKVQMGRITAEVIQKHLNELSSSGKAFSTVKKVYDAFNACFKWGVSARRLQFNPMGAVSIPGAAKQKKKAQSKNAAKSTVKFYTPEQQDALIAAATSKYPTGTPIYRFGYVVPFLLNTGLRLGELLGLQWKRDVDFDKRQISIDNSLVLVKNRNTSSTSKTVLLDQDSVKSESGERKIYLNDEALDALRHLYELTGTQTYVLSTKKGKPVQPSNIDRMLRNVRERAGIQGSNLGPHALRHSFATNLFRQHVDVKVISALLGHADVGVTSNIYMHVMDDQREDALIKIADRKPQIADPDKKEGAT